MTGGAAKAADRASWRGQSVTAIEPTRVSGERVKVRVGRRIVAVLRPGDVEELNLRVATVLHDDLLERIADRASFVAALDIALRRLRHQARSEAEIRTHLTERGAGAAHIDAVVSRLRELKLIDDRAFAREAISQTTRRAPAGERLMRDVLDRHGVEPGVAGEAIAQAKREAPDEEQQARTLIESRLATMSRLDGVAQARRLLGLLMRRGFEPEMAERLIREIVGLDD